MEPFACPYLIRGVHVAASRIEKVLESVGLLGRVTVAG
jgi:hypothetical protein